MKGYWRFSEGSGTLAHDFSGKGNHGTVSGAAWSSTVPTGSKVSTITGLTAEAAYRSVKLDWNAATTLQYTMYIKVQITQVLVRFQVQPQIV